jgi:hypothetical protein
LGTTGGKCGAEWFDNPIKSRNGNAAEEILKAEYAHDWEQSSAASLRTAGPAKEAPAGAVHCNEAADPKLLQLFVPPSADMKGGPEKLVTDGTEKTAGEGNLLEVVN